MEHDLHNFIIRAQGELQDEYQRIQKRAAQDPGTAGDQGEENWATLLKQWLPHYFHVVTKGRILTDTGYTSPQVDVLVLSPAYPQVLLDKKLYLSGGVAAAFECKNTLTSAHVKEAVKTSAKIKAALSKREGTPYKELHAGIIYGLLAHSHSWKDESSQPTTNIENALWEADAAEVHHPRECIDFITVSDLATWTTMKMTYLNPGVYSVNPELQKIYGSSGSAATGYICSAINSELQKEKFSPIGAFLSRLFSELAWTMSDMRQLEEYFRKVNLLGSGQGRTRRWDIDIYSEKIRNRIMRGELSNGVAYDEWHIVF